MSWCKHSKKILSWFFKQSKSILNLFFLVLSIHLYSFYPFLCTAEDPAGVTLQCRGLSMMAISTYAAKTRKRREKHKKDNTMTIASSEDEREDKEPAKTIKGLRRSRNHWAKRSLWEKGLTSWTATRPLGRQTSRWDTWVAAVFPHTN